MTAGLVGSVQLLSACEAQFAVPFPLRSRLAPSFESQTLPTLAHPWVVALAATRVFGPRAHSIFGQPSSPWTNTSCQNEKKKKKKKNPAPAGARGSPLDRQPYEGDSEQVESNTMTPHSRAEGRGPRPAMGQQGRVLGEPGGGEGRVWIWGRTETQCLVFRE